MSSRFNGVEKEQCLLWSKLQKPLLVKGGAGGFRKAARHHTVPIDQGVWFEASSCDGGVS